MKRQWRDGWPTSKRRMVELERVARDPHRAAGVALALRLWRRLDRANAALRRAKKAGVTCR